MASKRDWDFVVVGSGFGGSVSALRLAEKGYRVAVLEAGKRWRAEDFPKTDWDVRKHLWAPLLGCFGILRMSVFKDAFVLSGAGVGGGSLVYANTLLVPPDRFFEDPRWAGMDDWKAALEPHYETAKRMLGAVPAEHLAETDRLLFEVMKEMGREHTFHRPSVGVYFGEGPGVRHPDPFFGGEGPERAGCVLCGGCMVGCRHGAKNSLDRNYLWLAERRGAVIFPETRVTDVRPLDGGGYDVRTVRSTSPWLRRGRRRFTANQVVFAAGALGTTKLLFDCKARGSLPQLSERLGDFVRTNSEAIIGVEASRPREEFARGIAISAGAHPDDETHVETVRFSPGSDFTSLLATALTDEGPPHRRVAQWAKTTFGHPFRSLRTANPKGWSRRTVILLVMQPVHNYMKFVRKRRWYAPWSTTLQTRSDTDAKVKASIPIGNEVARRMARHVDGVPRAAVTEVLLNVPTTAHILGGASIGDSPETGVVDGRCRVYGHPGLYVVDGSMIPANLGVNPSLTITALAEHAMSFVPPNDGALESSAPAPDASSGGARVRPK